MSDHNDIPVKEVSELLEVVSSKVPKMLKDIMSSLYSEDTGVQLGKSVGAFYKELVSSGIPHEDAMEMTKDYLSALKSMNPSTYMNNGKK